MNSRINRQVEVIRLGRMEYSSAWTYQTKLYDTILAIKAANRGLPEDQQQPTPNYLLFCEHPHVFTLGKSGDENNLLIKPESLSDIGATFHHINRGGDITYHGPGQIVVYPVIDLENFFTDIHRYMRTLEESVILTLQEYGIPSGRIAGLTGVWLGDGDEARKICALGVKTSRWVTLHGLAFNVNTDLNYFSYIVPCGIADKPVTSMQKELGKETNLEEVRNVLERHLIDLFGFNPMSTQ
ncbi:MAG TPA: lipoyl(octanoyl) transferase LipB [Cyclobacteriaceae bacterium]|nr:lipoyl(octanoyl) transferase LipB [Cyclobacteriaceae bacterium]